VSIEAIRAATADARDQLLAAHHNVSNARERLAEALRTLTELSGSHSESLVPRPLALVDDQLAGCLELIAGSLDGIDRFLAGL
jgi:outer membrane protein TolC